jgi:hypothetical protein
MNLNLSTATAQTSPSLPGIAHTCGSSLHPSLLCRHSILWPRNDCPNKVSSSNAETGGTIASHSALSVDQASRISIASAVPSKLDEHDPPVCLVQRPRIPKNRISRGCLSADFLSPAPSKFDIDTSEPKPRDTDNAISCVITYGICSLLPPCFDVGGTTRRKDSSGRAFRPIPFGTGLASPLYPTHRVGVSITN